MADVVGPGDWVECIDASTPANRTYNPLALGALYCVDAVIPRSNTCPRDGCTCVLRLAKVVTKPPHMPGFCPSRFRPVYRPKAEVIQALLQPAPAKETEDA